MREEEEIGLVRVTGRLGTEQRLTGVLCRGCVSDTLPASPSDQLRPLTWPLGSLFGGRVLAFGLDGGRVEDARGSAVLAEVLLQTFDGSIQLTGTDLVVHIHEVWWRKTQREL